MVHPELPVRGMGLSFHPKQRYNPVPLPLCLLQMELPKALSVRRTFLSAIFHLLSRLPTAPLLRQLGFVGTPQVPQPLCREGVAAKLDGLQMPLDGRRSSSQALVHRRENGDAWLTQRPLRNVLWLSNEKILEEPGCCLAPAAWFPPPSPKGPYAGKELLVLPFLGLPPPLIPFPLGLPGTSSKP